MLETSNLWRSQRYAGLSRSRRGKRLFDVMLIVLSAWIWLPALFGTSLMVLCLSGWPIFYVSRRRVFLTASRKIFKFRCMVRNAERVANRDTIPVTDQRFLNIPITSPLYTRVGRLVEKLCLTELPQILNVIGGQMSIIGNRPLPENVIRSLAQAFPNAEDRFLTKTGLTGPSQLVGRTNLDDQSRLALEIDYCRLSMTRWTPRLDLAILILTVAIASGLRKPMTAKQVRRMMRRCAARIALLPERSRELVRG